MLFLYLATRSAGEGRRTALLAAGFLATSNMFVSLNRLAYPESLMICFAVLGWWCWLKGRYTLAGVALGLSCFTKLAGVPGIALPVLLLGRRFYDDFREGGGFRQLDRAERLCRLRQEIIRPGLRYLAGLTGVSSLIGAVIWLPNLRLLASTYAMTKYFNEPFLMLEHPRQPRPVPRQRFPGADLAALGLDLALSVGPSGPPPIAPQEQAISTPSVSDAGPHLALSWLAVNALAIAPLRFHPVHRYLVFLPALAWLAARGWQILPRLRWRAAAPGVFMRATDWRLGFLSWSCWPFFRLLAVLLTPALIRPVCRLFVPVRRPPIVSPFVWCALLAVYCCLGRGG